MLLQHLSDVDGKSNEPTNDPEYYKNAASSYQVHCRKCNADGNYKS